MVSGASLNSQKDISSHIYGWKKAPDPGFATLTGTGT
jgi:hypothetical protein